MGLDEFSTIFQYICTISPCLINYRTHETFPEDLGLYTIDVLYEYVKVPMTRNFTPNVYDCIVKIT
jgi:hypothetical protein